MVTRTRYSALSVIPTVANSCGITFVLETSQTAKPDAALQLLRRTHEFSSRKSKKKIKNNLYRKSDTGYYGDPDEIRTRVTAVKGRCLRPLDQRAELLVAVIGFEPMTLRV